MWKIIGYVIKTFVILVVIITFGRWLLAYSHVQIGDLSRFLVVSDKTILLAVFTSFLTGGAIGWGIGYGRGEVATREEIANFPN